MKKIILLALIVLTTSSIVFAQSQAGFKFSVGPELGFPSGSFSNSHSIGIGVTGQAEVSLQDHLYGTITGGVIAYNGKSSSAGYKYKGTTVVPLRVGVKYFLSGGIYAALQTGIAFLNNGGGTAFAYSPQAGYEFKTKNDKKIDLTFKYDGYSKNGTIGAIGFRLAYIF
jgi:hypothetical protein